MVPRESPPYNLLLKPTPFMTQSPHKFCMGALHQFEEMSGDRGQMWMKYVKFCSMAHNLTVECETQSMSVEEKDA